MRFWGKGAGADNNPTLTFVSLRLTAPLAPLPSSMGPPRPAADDPTADVDDDPLTRHPLYGGALAAALPARFCDVSAARPVPDHAEAWGDPESDQSIVFEVVVSE